MERKTRNPLTPDDRKAIEAGLAAGLSKRELARSIGRDHSVIVRESRRNSTAIGYSADEAYGFAAERHGKCRRRRRLIHGSAEAADLLSLIRPGVSPEIVAKVTGQACASTIRKFVSELPGKAWRKIVAMFRRKGRKSGGKAARRAARIPDLVPISKRPEVVASRSRFGDWEADLIAGASNRSHVLVLLERKSRFLILRRLDDASAATVTAALIDALSGQPPDLRLTLTCDRGIEMARHAAIAAALGLSVYFCDAHAPWQKGAVENCNGWLRIFLPKGGFLDGWTQANFDAIAEFHNRLPRRCLGWKSAFGVFPRQHPDPSARLIFDPSFGILRNYAWPWAGSFFAGQSKPVLAENEPA